MAKFENQLRLVTALRFFTGELPPGYAGEKEFFLTSLQSMAGHLEELQKETLGEVRAGFLRRLEAGKVTPEAIEAFKADIDRLVSNADFMKVSSGMAGSREYVRKTLDSVAPLSLVREEAKACGRDRDAERRINDAYLRLNFPALARQVEARPNDLSADSALAGARREVDHYCGLYRVPRSESDTLTPFSLSCVDAALAACYRLFKTVRKASGRAMP